MNITIEDIQKDLRSENENDAYYYDALNETGYHVHVDDNFKPVSFVRRTKDALSKIDEQEFVSGVNGACGNAVSANNYYEL